MIDQDQTLPDTRLEEIELRALAASREPWQVTFGNNQDQPHTVTTVAGTVVARTDGGGRWPAKDAAFIAAARTDVPALVDEIRRLRAAAAVGGPPRRSRRHLVAAGAAMLVFAIATVLSVADLWWGVFGIVMGLFGAFILGWIVRDTGHGR